MKVYYSEANYGPEEIEAALNILKNGRLALMNGENVRQVESEVSKIFNKKHGLMTNSGSSANLLAVLGARLPKDSLVITPSLTFSTTVAPIVQGGHIPLFVDVELDTLQVDPNRIYEAAKKFQGKVSAIFVPNLIGNVANWEAIRSISEEFNLKVFEDSADTLGYEYLSDEKELSDISTTSMYASHVVTGAGFGGVVCFNDTKDYEYAKSLRSWGRRSSKYEESEDFERRFSAKIDGFDYDDKYIFDDLGYNLIPSEISAAFALIQIAKLQENINGRISNFKYLEERLNTDECRTFSTYDNVRTGWLAFPIMLRGKAENKRKLIQTFLEKNNVQTRTIFTGNILRQPVAKKFKWESYSNQENADKIMKNGILLGCHNQMTEEKLDYQIKILKKSFDTI